MGAISGKQITKSDVFVMHGNEVCYESTGRDTWFKKKEPYIPYGKKHHALRNIACEARNYKVGIYDSGYGNSMWMKNLEKAAAGGGGKGKKKP
eukprot:NODE_5409_length_409_cov_91.125000_g4727_i0.p1 GENE.NODE_5409_length_409_cov_91.125000_g4727_i0~~NODE_5409_length_409_cov_91.125000_g4727_i0.p1  ORF type:complete len:93 (-),score=15.39 NODE_5409_length_409_cov_91.125000_g4727_i0:59-337(-)